MIGNEVLSHNGGVHYLAGLTNLVAGVANIVEHARIVKQRYLAREVIMACERLKQVARDTTIDVAEVVDRFNGELDRVNAIVAGRGRDETRWHDRGGSFAGLRDPAGKQEEGNIHRESRPVSWSLTS